MKEGEKVRKGKYNGRKRVGMNIYRINYSSLNFSGRIMHYETA